MAHRTQITLTDAQYEALVQRSARTGLSLAELTRRALDSTYRLPADPASDAIGASFGAWAEQAESGDAYVERLRPGLGRRLDG
jgi:hypothetical protein